MSSKTFPVCNNVNCPQSLPISSLLGQLAYMPVLSSSSGKSCSLDLEMTILSIGMLARSEHSLRKLISFAVDWEWKFLIGLKMIFTFVDSHMCSFDNRLKNLMTVSIFYKGRIQCWALLFQSGTLTDLMHHRSWVVNLYKLFFPSVHHSFLCLLRLVPYKVFSSHTSDTAEARRQKKITAQQMNILLAMASEWTGKEDGAENYWDV